jgi:hypothetical protein
VDVAIVFSADKKGAAERIRDGLAGEGYAVELAEGGGPAPAKAVIVLWSRSAMDSPAIQAAASEASKQSRLVEVSSDGIMPIRDRDDNRVVLLSGWRGEPFHPGWQRISAEVRRLCGAPRARPPAPARAPAPAAAAARASVPKRGALLAGLVVLVLALAGAGLWMLGREAPQPPPPAAVAEAPQPAPVTPLPPVATAEAPAVEVGQSVAPAAVATPEPARAEPRPKRSGPHYSPRQARTMRLFCQRAGRGTRECRVFRKRIAEGW